MAGDLIRKQLVAVIDERTTMVCLRAAGQIQPVSMPFDTLMGDMMSPPFHVHCRSIEVPWMPGFVSDIKAEANAEIMRRPLKERKFGPEGYTGSLPPPAATPATGYTTDLPTPYRGQGWAPRTPKTRNGWVYLSGGKEYGREVAPGTVKHAVTLLNPWDRPPSASDSVAAFLLRWLRERRKAGKRTGPRERASALRAEARRLGYDGIVFRSGAGAVTEILVLDKDQVR